MSSAHPVAAGCHETHYYIPGPSYWPVLASVGLALTLSGFAHVLHYRWYGEYLTAIGLLMVAAVVTAWFTQVIKENQAGCYNEQVDRTFRWAMAWFIFSEVCFFGAFFSALFYARFWTLPFLSGDTYPLTHDLVWPSFKAAWPLLINPDNAMFTGSKGVVSAWGLPALNTLILLTSGVTITWAHFGLKYAKQAHLILGLIATIGLGIVFLICQAYEYTEAYHVLGLTLGSGIYGSTFFMLTGFHGLHVCVGTLILIAVLIRAMKKHFTEHNHFAFEAAAWYWHFVDVVWLFLFVFVYWL